MQTTTPSATMQTIQDERDYIVQTYIRPDFVLERGAGMMLYDTDGKAYQDWVAGIAVNALGYGDAGIAQAAQAQFDTGIIHVSNLYHTAPHAELAKQLVQRSFADRVFFSNSGTEANEGAIKFARRLAYNGDNPHKRDVVTFTGAFHGRTLGSLSLTPKEKYQKPFGPLLPGVKIAEFNNVDSARQVIDDNTAAVIVEPVQGEGGIYAATDDFLQAVRDLCDQHNAVLIFDEIQCGVGRTGTLWAHEHSGITPDIMTLAKPLAAGLPVGAILVTQRIADALQAGDHGSTFAGGPVVMRVAQYVLNRIDDADFMANVTATGDYLRERLSEINSPLIKEVRGRGLMCALELHTEVAPLIKMGFENGLLMVNAGTHVIRFVPPLIAQPADVDHLIETLVPMMEALSHA